MREAEENAQGGDDMNYDDVVGGKRPMSLIALAPEKRYTVID